MKKSNAFLILFIGILGIAGLLFIRPPAPSTVPVITFPSDGEELVQGQTYTLRWIDGIDPIQIFLVDTSLKSKGASVSISDRIYGIKNEQAYEYKIPETMKPGEYEFQIGNMVSEVFRIITKDEIKFINELSSYRCGEGTEFTVSSSVDMKNILLVPATSVERISKTILSKASTTNLYEGNGVQFEITGRTAKLSTKKFTTVCNAF